MSLNIEFEMQALDKSSWLCPNCVYSKSHNTAQKPIEPINFCNDHKAGVIQDVKVVNKSIETITINKENLIGLCASCNVSQECSLRSEERSIFNCEYYY